MNSFVTCTRPLARRLARFAAFLLVAGIAPVQLEAQRPHHLTADSARFLYDGAPFQVISGEMHYARIPREYWRDRLRKARAMGLNTISTYVFWNAHEAVPGQYDFSGQNDVATFIRIAGEEGLHVTLRPGPYVCAEWELGGYPAWLFADSSIVLRSTDPRFTAPAARWLDRLGRELAPLLASRGGPITAVQVENEYGSFDHDPSYLRWQYDALLHAGFGSELLFTADGDVQLPNGTIAGVPAVVNFGTGEVDSSFARLIRFRPAGPRMSGEYWAGWFDQWGRKHAKSDAAKQVGELDSMLARGYSVNLYMFHGGTTFGFMNGANVDGGRYWPQTTSYDYDAALDESGRPTPKYYAFRDVITRRTGRTPPDIPASPPPVAIAAFPLHRAASTWSIIGVPVRSEYPRSMEAVGQSTGYILYRTRATGRGVMLRVRDVRDYAQVYRDGALVGTLDRRLRQDSLEIDVPATGAQLDILVENLGRVNFAKPLLDERKGITKSVTLDGRELTGWEIYRLPMNAPWAMHGDTTANGPSLYRGSFDTNAIGDTFLDTRGWGKGAVWINGHALGRFWSIGPQQTLYVPGPWLRARNNEIVVFDQMTPDRITMAGLRAPVLDERN